MAEIFKNISKIEYEGADSKNPLAFKFYDADKIVFGKKMSEHLPFAMAWWLWILPSSSAGAVTCFGAAGKAMKRFSIPT